jgi:hypothetical protein
MIQKGTLFCQESRFLDTAYVATGSKNDSFRRTETNVSLTYSHTRRKKTGDS